VSALRRLVAAAAVVLACQGQVPQFISVGDVSLPIVTHPEFYSDCRSAADSISSRELAFASIAFHFTGLPEHADPSKHYFVVAVDEQRSYIQIPTVTWPNMTPEDTNHLAYLTQALEWHERGHLAIAVALADQVTAEHRAVQSPADAQVQANAFVRMSEEKQIAYDNLVSHGIHQSRAPAGLRGNDTIFYCK
jgi:hypothetical protein